VRSLKGDLAGGISAGVLTIPVSMGYGILALQPLGDGYVAHGVVAGLVSAIVVLLAAALLGGSAGLMYTPRSVVTLIMAAVVLEGVVRGRAAVAARGDVYRTLTLVFFVVVAAGLFQALFGALRLGSLIRYIPSPVMAGFQNAVAVLIIAAQVNSLLGFRRPVRVAELGSKLGDVQPLTLAVGLLTFLAMWQGPRLTKRIPPVILGLLVGTGAYYVLVVSGYGPQLGPVVGPMPDVSLFPRYLPGFGLLLVERHAWPALLALGIGAFSLAVISSLDVLLCVRVMDGVIGERSRGSRELVRIGVGNMAAACFGGIASGLNLGASVANHRAGGRTRLASMAAAVVVLLAVLLLSPAIALLPRVVIAGMLLVVGVQLFDQWSLRLLVRTVTGGLIQWRRMALDLLVALLVAASILVFDPVVGVAMGVTVAVLFFIVRMSRSVVRRTYRGDAVRSRKARDPKLTEILAAQGGRIVVFELEGPIFFGTAEDLATRVEAVSRAGASHVLLDLRRVNELDTTGARILIQIHDRLKRQGGRLLFSHAGDNPLVSTVLRDLGVASALGQDVLFADTDAALEWAEEQVIRAHGAGDVLTDEIALDRLSLLEDLTEAERAVVRTLLVRRAYSPGEVVIKEGSLDRDLFLISKGTVSVRIEMPGQGRRRRLASFAAGTVFGEVALLDQQPRSATVTADDESVCYVLSEDAFHALVRDHHGIAIKLLTNLGRELSRRVRRANAMMSQLEG
jgi:SulP family sulfate permease